MNPKIIFVAGNVMTGKNILRKLLDGHPNLVCNHVHDRIAMSLLSEEAKQYITRAPSKNLGPFQDSLPTLKITYPCGRSGAIDFPDLLNMFFRYGDYRMLQKCARGKRVVVASKEGAWEGGDFNFDIRTFEKQIEVGMNNWEGIGGSKTIEELIQMILRAYIASWLDIDRGIEEIGADTSSLLGFVDTLSRGIAPIKRAIQELSDPKILIMDRNPPSLLFANATRLAYQSGWLGLAYDEFFRAHLYSQREFAKRLQKFRADAKELELRYENVKIVDFDKMILDTSTEMNEIARFLEISFDPILTQPSIAGKVLTDSSKPLVGKINDDPYSSLNRKELFLLESLSSFTATRFQALADAVIRIRIKIYKLMWRIGLASK